ncbi:protein kinase domain-containing protein [Caldisericum sp. AR60]|uniref:protein kinase domain-containing protein n=1 Tax=Caldisericum sp. AR60 TaxID=3397852 RepID=UPI0039FBE314
MERKIKCEIKYKGSPVRDANGQIVYIDLIEPGSVCGNFRIKKFLAIGGMSIVYEAKDTRPDNKDKTYAFKEIKKNRSELTELTEFEKVALELKGLLQTIDHPNIVHVYDLLLVERELIDPKSGDKQKIYRVYLVEEFIEGKSLSKIFEENGYNPLKEEKVLKWGIQLCEAVTYLQERKIIHRDIKPGNLILTPTEDIKLTDFGIARVFKEENWQAFLRGGQGDGDTIHAETAEYSPPEQTSGATFFGSDVFSIGATMYVLLGGKDAKNFLSKRRGDVSIHQSSPFPPLSCKNEQLGHIISKAVELDYNKRYQTASEMLKDLQSIGGGVGIGVPPYKVSSKPPSPPTFISPTNRELIEVLVSTQNGIVISGDYITFKWSKVGDADYYNLQVSDSPDFRNIICNEKLSGNSYQIRTDSLLSGKYSGGYYVRIFSINKGGSNYNQVFFEIKTYAYCSLKCNNQNCPRKFPLPLKESWCDEGKPLEPLTKRCPYCGTYNVASAKYCDKCGKPL